MPIPQLKEPAWRIRKIGERMADKLRQQKKSKSPWKKILAHWLPIAIIAVMVIILFGIGAFAWYSRDLPNPDKIIDRTDVQSTKIYARDGSTLLYEIHGEKKRTVVNLEDIPDYMKQATIAVEDKNFYTNHGFSLSGIVKAVCHEAFGNLGGLCPQRGGSTITQQFVKNAILTSERSYSRKIKELVLSYQLDRKFSKDQILKLYLNEIPYGSNAYGAESAALTYFGISAKDLTLAQSALLAALPQAPSYYSPYGNNIDALIARQHLILKLMVDQGYITQERADAAKAEDVMKQVRAKSDNITAPHFVMYVKELLADKYGEKAAEQGGLKVITTLDIDKQKAAESAIQKQAAKNLKNYNANNASLVSLDTKTGQILAMVGSKDYFNQSIDGNVNVALRPRQPGSSFKPFVYAAAFKKGFTPETMLFDLVTNFKTDMGQDYTPHNYDSKEHGLVSMRQALAGSLNIPAVKTLYLAGIDNVLDLADDIGYTTLGDRSRFGLSLVLGGGEVTLLEHTSAYATLAREGLRHPTAAILKVEDSKGKVLEQFENREEKVLDENVARLVTSILTDNEARAYIFGSKNYLTLPDRPVAAKTGTTNDYHDAWTLGYTPSIATGVWVGNNDNSAMKRGADGSIVAAPIWNDYMKQATKGVIETFKAPKPNSAKKPILQGQTGSEIKYNVDSVTGKIIPDSCLATYPSAFIVKKSFKEIHDILYYVNKDDPDGPQPADPAKDPQYNNWEAPVKKWAEANHYNETKPAMESCDLRTEKNLPVVAFISPVSGATVTSPTFTAQASATSAYPITKISYYLDEKLIATSDAAPFAIPLTVEGVENGFHDLKAEATDSIGNVGTATISINYLLAT